MLTESELKLVLEMQAVLAEPTQEDGIYSVYEYFRTKCIEYAGETHSLHYVRDRVRGDYVTNGEVIDNVYIGKRIMVWAANVADPEFSGEAETKGLPSFLQSGECFMSLKDTSTDPCRTKWSASRALRIPDGHMGLVAQAYNNTVGYVTVVQKQSFR